MAATKSIAIKLTDLREAYAFVSAGNGFEHSGYICLDTGRIYCRSTLVDIKDDDMSEDIETSDRYLAVPDQRDLKLGRRVALDFAAQVLPDDFETAAGLFRRRGAFRAFKDLLERRDLLEQWYEFEDRATNEALVAWCEENDIEVIRE